MAKSPKPGITKKDHDAAVKAAEKAGYERGVTEMEEKFAEHVPPNELNAALAAAEEKGRKAGVKQEQERNKANIGKDGKRTMPVSVRWKGKLYLAGQPLPEDFKTPQEQAEADAEAAGADDD